MQWKKLKIGHAGTLGTLYNIDRIGIILNNYLIILYSDPLASGVLGNLTYQ
jgi:hypothetical protein